MLNKTLVTAMTLAQLLIPSISHTNFEETQTKYTKAIQSTQELSTLEKYIAVNDGMLISTTLFDIDIDKSGIYIPNKSKEFKQVSHDLEKRTDEYYSKISEILDDDKLIITKDNKRLIQDKVFEKYKSFLFGFIKQTMKTDPEFKQHFPKDARSLITLENYIGKYFAHNGSTFSSVNQNHDQIRIRSLVMGEHKYKSDIKIQSKIPQFRNQRSTLTFAEKKINSYQSRNDNETFTITTPRGITMFYNDYAKVISDYVDIYQSDSNDPNKISKKDIGKFFDIKQTDSRSKTEKKIADTIIPLSHIHETFHIILTDYIKQNFTNEQRSLMSDEIHSIQEKVALYGTLGLSSSPYFSTNSILSYIDTSGNKTIKDFRKFLKEEYQVSKNEEIYGLHKDKLSRAGRLLFFETMRYLDSFKKKN